MSVEVRRLDALFTESQDVVLFTSLDIEMKECVNKSFYLAIVAYDAS